ncbi:hypothetical protein [Gluconobacter morbifer]|uniref:Uncharacterized protein n=1 Tax=Gluconobacter morbifer G707 TaxID=1088869 RepID=G6XJY3_9PROT|nr:hypothetical protein [Gluconobacter morbifer]EHH67945.1 hypothetical protein GMO_17120 [Gluconobacter morbifer G707]
MIVQDHPYFCNMPEDMRYYRPAVFPEGFIEKSIVFVLPDRLRKFRRNLWHVRRNPGDDAVYMPLFRVNCVLESEPQPTGLEGPFDIYPFYTRTTKTRSRELDYYVLFLFREKLAFLRCQELTGDD